MFGYRFRVWYSKNFYAILENVIMLYVGLIFVVIVCAIIEFLGR